MQIPQHLVGHGVKIFFIQPKLKKGIILGELHLYKGLRLITFHGEKEPLEIVIQRTEGKAS